MDTFKDVRSAGSTCVKQTTREKERIHSQVSHIIWIGREPGDSSGVRVFSRSWWLCCVVFFVLQVSGVLMLLKFWHAELLVFWIPSTKPPDIQQL